MNYFFLITKIAFLTAMNARTGVLPKPSKSRPPSRRETERRETGRMLASLSC